MTHMFNGASTFNQDLSQWDVSHVNNMRHMFNSARAFNQDLWKWEVSAVTDMGFMFSGAHAFKQKLCGVSWVHSRADKTGMFMDTTASISPMVCAYIERGMVVVVRIKHFAFIAYGQGEGYGQG